MSHRTNYTFLALLIILAGILSYTFSFTTAKLSLIISPPSHLTAQAVSSLSQGLLIHYPFDEGSGATASDAAGSNTGTLTNGLTWTTGKVGSGALQFDGVDDYVTSASTISVPSSNQFTVAFWVKSSALVGGAYIAWGTNRSCGRDAQNIRCTVDGDATGAASAPSVLDGTWHHIVFVNDGNTQTIYKDGVQAGSATETLVINNATLRIGNRQTSSSYTAAAIDDVRLYGRILSSTEIQDLFNGTASNPTTPTPTPTPTATQTPAPTTTQTPTPSPTPSTPSSSVDVSQGLIARWSFDADTFDGPNADTYKTIRFSDSSGSGNVADCQSAFALNGTTYNQCPRLATGPDNSNAAQFSAVKDTCDLAGDYLAVGRSNQLNQLPSGSLSLWVNPANTTDITQRIVDTYKTGTPRTWQFHRDGDMYYTFSINADNGAEMDVMTFPGGAANVWAHYLITWDGITIKGYYNGVQIASVPMSGIAAFDLGAYLAFGALMHGDPRNMSDGGNCVNSYGAAAGSYVFPNAGFFSGKLDDIRFYNRAVTAAEAAQIASATLTPSQEFVLRVTKNGTGLGTVAGGGISCGKHCAERYANGATVTLTATPALDSVFSGWSGVCSGTGSCVVTMNALKDVGAQFTRIYPVITTVQAEAGSVISPFIVSGGAVYQTRETLDPATGGRAAYTFSLTKPTDIVVAARIDAPSQSANSFFVGMDAEPDTSMIWHTNTTGGFEEQFVSWGGSTSGGNAAKTFSLSAGAHTLVIRGREANAYIDSITLLDKNTAALPSSDTNPPVISGIQASSITANAATILFSTNEAADTQIEYGLTTAYGNTTTLNTALSTSHSQVISGLQAATTYHYRILTKDAAGNRATSGDATFITTSGALPVNSGSGPHWYVDVNATGLANGTSWANAWNSFAKINWTAVKPGHTIWISGGTYNEVLAIAKGGSAGLPITIKVSQEAGHNDRVIINGRISIGVDWITIDGAKNDSYGGVIGDNTFNVPLVKNNINLFVDSSSLPDNAINIWSGGPDNVKIKWIEVTNKDAYLSGGAAGIRVNAGDIKNSEIAYVWVHDIGGTGVSIRNNSVLDGYDDIIIHHSLIEGLGNDGIEGVGAFTSHHNIIANGKNLYGAHPDGLSGPANYVRWYNNILYNWPERAIYPLMWNTPTLGTQIYGNLIYDTSTFASTKSEATTFMGVEGVAPTAPMLQGTDIYWDGVVYANNTIIANGAYQNAVILGNRFAPLNNNYAKLTLHYKNWAIKNNIIYGGTLPTIGIDMKGYTDSGIDYGEADLQFDHNIVSGLSTNANAKTIQYSPRERAAKTKTPYSNAEAFNAATAYKNNKSAQPKFKDYANYDYSLASDDTAAVDAGTNLVSLNLPGIDKDITGAPRGQGNGWDIGAFESGSTSTTLPPVQGGGSSSPTPTPSTSTATPNPSPSNTPVSSTSPSPTVSIKPTTSPAPGAGAGAPAASVPPTTSTQAPAGAGAVAGSGVPSQSPNITPGVSPIGTAPTVTSPFNRPLSIGTSGADVKELQKLLNTSGYTISTSGAGSPGNESTYFGPATEAALKRFQCTVFGICSGSSYGSLDQTTITLLTKKPTIPTPTTTKYTFTRTLKLGQTGTDVKQLQIFLNNNGYTIATTGAGSKGNESTYFGPATSRAVSRFQEAYRAEILTPSGLTKGTGNFGPATLKKVNSLGR